jgi:hypothetical protein
VACYRPGGCADIIAAVAERIDARQFNPAFPRTFPRFVQHAMWQYCSRSGLDVCNGNRINDAKRCGNMDCRVRPSVSVSLCTGLPKVEPRTRKDTPSPRFDAPQRLDQLADFRDRSSTFSKSGANTV